MSVHSASARELITDLFIVDRAPIRSYPRGGLRQAMMYRSTTGLRGRRRK